MIGLLILFIIGVGVGGIVIFVCLVKVGLKVMVLEKNDFMGGRCSIFRFKVGFCFD